MNKKERSEDSKKRLKMERKGQEFLEKSLGIKIIKHNPIVNSDSKIENSIEMLDKVNAKLTEDKNRLMIKLDKAEKSLYKTKSFLIAAILAGFIVGFIISGILSMVFYG